MVELGPTLFVKDGPNGPIGLVVQRCLVFAQDALLVGNDIGINA